MKVKEFVAKWTEMDATLKWELIIVYKGKEMVHEIDDRINHIGNTFASVRI